MSKILKPGQYGLINGHVFYDVSFDQCVNNTNLPNIEVERKLFRSTDVKFVTQGEIEINKTTFEVYLDTVHYYEEKYAVNFIVQIKSGILYVLEVKNG